MKKFLFLGIGSALMFTMGGVGPAQADNGVHINTQGTASTTFNLATTGAAQRCSSCHRAHTAKATYLLKQAQPALCYTCHGTGGSGATTDVQAGVRRGSTSLALRGGGFDFAKIGAGAAVKTLGIEPVLQADGVTYVPVRQAHSATIPVGASEATTSKHQIDGSTSGTMWGNGAISATENLGKASVTLECGSCHDPHGNGNYRILKPVPNDAATSEVKFKAAVIASLPGVTPVVLASPQVDAVAAVVVAPINIPDATSYGYTTTDYWSVVDPGVAKVSVNVLGQPVDTSTAPVTTDGYIANASQWCSTCHTRYQAKSPAWSTDSTDKVFAYRHTSNRVDKGGVERPNCIQCHVSHGSNASMTGQDGGNGLDPGDATAVATDSKLLRVDQRGTCAMCHNV